MRLIAIVLASLLSATSVGAQIEKSKPPAKPGKGAKAAVQLDAPTPEKRSVAYNEFFKAQQYESEGNFVQAVESYKKVVELDPKSPEPRVALGELYFRNRNLKDAESMAREAVVLNNDSIGAHRLLGRILVNEAFSNNNKEKMQEAIVHFLEITRLDKNDAEAWKLLGTIHSSLGDNDKALEAYQNLISTGLAGTADYLELSRLLYLKGKFREAAKTARQAYEQSDGNAQAGLILADSLLRSGQTVDAIEIFKNVLKEFPTDSRLVFGLAESLMRAGRYDEASQQLQKILEANPKNLRALSLLAQVQRRAGKREEAVTTLKQAIQGQDITDSLDLQVELAEVYEEMGQIDESAKAYEEGLAGILNPDGSVSDTNRRFAGGILQALALLYRNNGQRDKAFQVFDRMRKTLGADSIVPDVLMIDTLRTEGKYREAAEAAKQAQARFPKERQFKFMEAYALSLLQQPDQAMNVLKTLLTGAEEDADVYSYAAFIMLDNNRLDEAEKNARKALQYDEKNISFLVTLSSIQDRAKNYKDSEETLKRVLAIDPDNATALNNLGYFLTERNERLNEALEYIQRAINIEPNNGSFLDSLGWVYYKLGKIDLAAKYLEQAVSQDKRSATVREHLGDVYLKLGRIDEARKQWQQALELTTDKEEVGRLKDKLRDNQANSNKP